MTKVNFLMARSNLVFGSCQHPLLRSSQWFVTMTT